MTKRFGAYEILHELKSGGMGAVLLGRRRGPGTFEQVVAIKTIRAEYAAAQAVRAMFLDEAAILARINHPGIATVHDFGEEAGTLYMVMEYVAGNSLRGLVELQLPPVIAARAIAEAARGLHAAHEARDSAGQLLGLVHRDISPDNLMLGFDGHVKVIDFGIALVKNRQAPVTELGTVKGKPPYMSPEQVKNEAMDRRSDVFSLAVVLHELLTGRPLFDGDSIYAIARAVEHQQLLPPSAVRGEPLPAGLDAVVMAALDRDPARRTPSAAQLAEDLERVIGNAGEETLASWAARELAAPREAHRGWLAKVVAGVDAPRPLGRPTGSVTQLGPEIADALAATPARPAAIDAPPDTPTHLPPSTGQGSPAPRRSLAPLVIALFALLAVVAGVLLMRGHATTTTPDASVVADTARSSNDGMFAPLASDAGVDAPAPDAPELDAPAPDAPELDAPARIDAGAKRVPTDAGRVASPPRDATTATVERPDAAAATAVTGTGTLSVRNKRGGVYLNIVIDGRTIGVTPLIKHPFPAGHHTLQLLAPDTGTVVDEQPFDLADGASLSLQQR